MDYQSYAPYIQELRKEYERLASCSDPNVIHVLHKLRREATALEDDLLLGNTYYCYAFTEFFIRGNYDAFLKHLRKAARYLFRCDDPTELAHVYYLIGLDAMNKRMYDIAYNQFLQARDLFARAKDENSAAILNMSIGHVLLLLADYRNARVYLKDALRVIRLNKQHPHYYSNTAAIYITDAISCLGLDKLGSAETVFRRAAAFIARHQGHLRAGIDFDFALLGARLSLAKNDLKTLRIYCEDVTRLLFAQPQMVGYMDEIRKLCEELLKAGEYNLVGMILKPFEKASFPPDSAYALLVLQQIRGDYYLAIRDTRGLQKSYKEQRVVHLQLLEEQKRLYLHQNDLIQLISDLRQEQETMQEERRALMQIALTDALTGIPNRTALDNYLDQAFEYAWRNDTTLGISLIDIDDLKTVNDTRGHAEGDRLLVEFASILQEHTQEDRIFCARYGGDEFILVYEGMSNSEILSHARTLAKKSSINISQGICNQKLDETMRIWDLLNCADHAMYEAKRAKKKQPRTTGIRLRSIKSAQKK